MALYGLFSIIGLYAAVFIALKLRIKHQKRDLPLLMCGLAGMILGAKIPLWLSYGFNDGTILQGKSLLGGILGAFLAINLYKFLTHRTKENFGDNFAVGLAAGAGFGKIGCFFNGCCGGRHWGFLGIEHYPTQLMESAFNFIMAIILYKLFKTGKAKNMLFHIYVTSYLAMRFLIEFIRTEPRVWAGLTVYQLAALIFLPLFIFIIRKRYAQNLGA